MKNTWRKLKKYFFKYQLGSESPVFRVHRLFMPHILYLLWKHWNTVYAENILPWSYSSFLKKSLNYRKRSFTYRNPGLLSKHGTVFRVRFRIPIVDVGTKHWIFHFLLLGAPPSITLGSVPHKKQRPQFENKALLNPLGKHLVLVSNQIASGQPLFIILMPTQLTANAMEGQQNALGNSHGKQQTSKSPWIKH